MHTIEVSHFFFIQQCFPKKALGPNSGTVLTVTGASVVLNVSDSHFAQANSG